MFLALSMTSSRIFSPIYFQGYVTPKINHQEKFINKSTASILTHHKFHEYGIYYGWSKLPTELSYNIAIINITFNGQVEIHILKEYDIKFYGTHIDLIISGLIETDDYIGYAKRMIKENNIFW